MLWAGGRVFWRGEGVGRLPVRPSNYPSGGRGQIWRRGPFSTPMNMTSGPQPPSAQPLRGSVPPSDWHIRPSVPSDWAPQFWQRGWGLDPPLVGWGHGLRRGRRRMLFPPPLSTFNEFGSVGRTLV